MLCCFQIGNKYFATSNITESHVQLMVKRANPHNRDFILNTESELTKL